MPAVFFGEKVKGVEGLVEGDKLKACLDRIGGGG